MTNVFAPLECGNGIYLVESAADRADSVPRDPSEPSFTGRAKALFLGKKIVWEQRHFLKTSTFASYVQIIHLYSK